LFVEDFCDRVYLAFVASLHVVLGVCVPWRAEYVGDSKPVTALLVYQAQKATISDGRLVVPFPGGRLFWTQMFMPVSSMLGLVAPMLAIYHYYHKPEVPNLDVGSHFMVISMCCTSVWLLGKLLLSMAKIDYIMLHAADAAINSLIDDLPKANQNDQYASFFPNGLNWQEFADKYRDLDALLETVWSLQCVGGLFAFRAFVLGFASIVFGAFGVAFEDVHIQLVIQGTGVCFGIGCVMVLYTAARVTGRCRDKSYASHSLMSAVTANIATSRNNAEEARAFQNLMAYMQMNPMGIKVAGVDITAEFVFSNGMRLLAQAPTAFLFLGRYLRK